ncbi:MULTISPECIES: hypothetical protein [Nocardia]|uniref:hypothetical protein n=1 Tax=Nocardia TaxID=1817 RepID=UPI0013003820|nr:MULTISPECIES: hypothetical protein [Nocardia]
MEKSAPTPCDDLSLVLSRSVGLDDAVQMAMHRLREALDRGALRLEPGGYGDL